MDARKPLCLVLAMATGGGACATHPVRVATAEPEAVSMSPATEAPQPVEGPGLRFDVQPGAARVFVDGHAVGTAASLRDAGGLLSLAPGVHQVSIRHAGYATWRAEVTVGEEAEAIQVRLLQDP
ncbi:PEGA domain-containing protein [Corallococcus sp. M34]|uniref:PEGA domain-containing protein n=1 Tax=Citreicoccus inhibens TaxID=2849499 RepID=UPI001C24ECA9|nr:PEGA domain-containing protein [Citreicoccus inhibens]MBU8897828.1 PEGA domain-containing protein [Citreicoccus inhibens]